MNARKGPRSSVALILLLLILSYAAYVRFYHLREDPGWYADEGTDIDIATHMMEGRQQYLAIGQSTLVAARLPLFPLLLASLFSLFGRDIVIVRLLTAAYGVLIVFLLFFWGRRMWGTGVALLAAALYAVWPNAALYSRFGFLYNQVAFLYLVLFYTLWRFLIGGGNVWLAMACLSVGISVVTSVSSLPMIGFVVLSLLLTRPSRLWWALPLMMLAPAVYGSWMMVVAPNAFLYDLDYLFNRVGGSLVIRALLAVWNYKELLRWDVWFVLGAFGLTRLKDSQAHLYTNLFFWFSLFTTVGGVPRVAGLGYHYVIPLLPWAAVGTAAFAIWAFPRLLTGLQALYDRLFAYFPWPKLPSRWHGILHHQGRLWLVGLLLFWILISPLVAAAIETSLLPLGARVMVPPEIEQVTIRNIEDAESAVAYVNQHARPEDVVLAPPHVAWLVKAHVADFQQSVAYSGGETQNYPDDMDRGRFLFDVSLQNAKYAVLWDGWREWEGSTMPDVNKVYQVIETWPIAYERGDWRVYVNPEAQHE